MGLKEIPQMYIRSWVDRSMIVARSAELPGVNKSCVRVCVCVCFQMTVISSKDLLYLLYNNKD